MSYRKCAACGRRGVGCICKSVQRRHLKENDSDSLSAGQAVVHKAHKGSNVVWCSECGCQFKNGKCSNVKCINR